MIATALLIRFDSATPVAIYLIGLCAITFIAVLASKGLKKDEARSLVKVTRKTREPHAVMVAQDSERTNI